MGSECSIHEEMKNSCRILDGKREGGGDSLKELHVGERLIIKSNLKEGVCGSYFNLFGSGEGPVPGYCEYNNPWVPNEPGHSGD